MTSGTGEPAQRWLTDNKHRTSKVTDDEVYDAIEATRKARGSKPTADMVILAAMRIAKKVGPREWLAAVALAEAERFPSRLPVVEQDS